MPHKWAVVIHHPCLLGNKSGAQKGGSATSPLLSRGFSNKGTKSKVAHKWAEVVRHHCVVRFSLREASPRPRKQKWPTKARECNITLAFSEVTKQGDKVKRGPQVERTATSPFAVGGPLHRGTETKVAHKWTQALHYPCVLGRPQTRGQSQRWPTSERKCYINPAFSKFPYRRGWKQHWPTKGRKRYITLAFSTVLQKGDKVEGGPQVGGSGTSRVRDLPGEKVKGGPQMGRTATSPLRSRGCPQKGTETKVAHERAEVLHQPGVLGGPKTRGQKKRWPTRERKCYVTLHSLGSFTQGNRNKRGPLLGGSVTSPLRSWGTPNNGTKSKVAHKWAKVLQHPCVLGDHQT